MTATLTDVATAVVDELNAGTWSLPFTAERKRFVPYSLEAIATLMVPVVATSTDTEQFTRGATIKLLTVDVGVIQKPDEIDEASIDPLVALVDELADHFQNKRLDSLPRAMCTTSRPDPIFDPEKLDKKRSFFSVLRLEFRFYP